MKPFRLKIPASSANVGCGFDSIGIAISLYLTVTAVPADVLTIEYTGDSPDNISLDPLKNFLIQVSQYVCNCYGKSLPGMTVCIDNPIPLGRGMGSSGSAVVAGVALANESLQLNLSKQQMLDLCCVVEGHPDNIAPSLLGGLVASYIRSPLEPYTSAHYLPNTLLTPPDSMTYSRCLKMNPQIKAVVIVPDFQVKTTDARNALPETYTRADVVFNLSRAAVLTHELCSDSLEATIISEAMQDQIHQPYREILVPGLQEALAIKPDSIGGLLGVCLSGAGPSILALATHGFDDIGITISQILQRYIHEGSHIESFYHVLDIDTVGLVVEHFSSN